MLQIISIDYKETYLPEATTSWYLISLVIHDVLDLHLVDIGLFFSNIYKSNLIGYADARHLSDPHNGFSQKGYLFTCGNTTISWQSMKQIITTTSSSHAEITAIDEASRESV